jgi:HAD superfamily hydrolase (TIGR01509 family)
MTLKAVLFDFNGVIINDEPIHQELINELLIGENIRPLGSEYNQFCLGKSDRLCLTNILVHTGRMVTNEYLDRLISLKTKAYQTRIESLEKLPMYHDVMEVLPILRGENLLMGIVSGALRSEIDLILESSQIKPYFDVIVGGDDIENSKPDPEGYLLAVEKLTLSHPDANIRPENCLVIEDTLAGIQAAKNAQMQVVGLAHTYPVHLLQRQANWSVDYLNELEWPRIRSVFAGECYTVD